ncbi:MAG: sialate O-acetylesterase [Treponema sp.]|jgi:hypothetical protein|nr:sialate O-acetylesterase [Treponema sp.]
MKQITAILVAVAVFITACGDDGPSNPGSGSTPKAGDYDFDNMEQRAGSVVPVKITPKSGMSSGARTIRYAGKAALPQEQGSYAVTFNVAAADGWNAAANLSAGNLKVLAPLPVADDFTIGNMNQRVGSVSPVAIAPKSRKSSGKITIKYNNNAALPGEKGSYAVTFDVEAAEGWDAVTGLSAGDLHIEEYLVGPANGPGEFQVYLCFGQSNMEGVNNTTSHFIPEEYRSYTNDRFQVLAAVDMPKLKRTKENWYTASPPLVCDDRALCPADFFGRAMVGSIRNPDVKVGVIIVAVSGAALDIFDKANYADYIDGLGADTQGWMHWGYDRYDGKPYERLVELAKIAQGEGGVIKGILLHQGESGGGKPSWGENVKRIYDNLLDDLGLASESIPLLAGEPIRWNKNLINGLPAISDQFHVISSEGCEALKGEDADHFSPAGMAELGRRYANKMLDLLYP